MGELAKIESFKKQLALVETFDEIKLIGNAAEAYQQLMIKQKVSTAAQNEIGEFIIEVEERKGEYLEANYPSIHPGSGRGNKTGNKTEPVLMPASKKESTRARTIKKADKNKKDKIKDKIKKAGGIITPNKLFNELKKEDNLDIKKQREQNESKQNSIQMPIIIHADCMDLFDKIPDIDLLIADPPYFTDGNFIEQISSYLTKVKPTGQAYVFMSADPDELIAYLNMDRHHLNLTQVLVWNYNNTGQRQPNVKYNSNYQLCFYFRGNEAPNINKPADGKEQYACQTINAPDARREERYFKWQKPDDLIERFIRNSSKPGGFVFDPFAGSGTTLITASKLGRIGMGCDIDKSMVEICIKRGCKNEQL
jgi:DNA modification methylase